MATNMTRKPKRRVADAGVPPVGVDVALVEEDVSVGELRV